MSVRYRNAFTLVEILIVVMILGILASIVIPRYANATDASRRATAADQLRLFRDQISVYRAQHRDQWPGVTAAVPGGTVAMFVAHITSYTDADSNAVAMPDATHKFGPYLPSIPVNPISGMDTVKYDWTYDAEPAADNTTGWVYQPFTGHISINQTGTDGSGKAYTAY